MMGFQLTKASHHVFGPISLERLDHAQTDDLLRVSVLVLAVATALALIIKLQRNVMPSNSPPLWKPDDWPLLGALRFFTHRADMVLEASKFNTISGSGSGNFSFFIGKKHVIGLGVSAQSRIRFFENKDMSLMIG